jgi:hypothetical protein
VGLPAVSHLAAMTDPLVIAKAGREAVARPSLTAMTMLE